MLFIVDMEENIRAAANLGIAAHRFCGVPSLRQALDYVLRAAGTQA